MSNPDLDSLTTTGRINAPEPPEDPTPLDELTVAEFGSAFVNDYAIRCPEQSENACPFAYSGRKDLQNYSMGMLATYPECEACGCMLEVLP